MVIYTHSRRKLHAFTKKTSHAFTKKTSQFWPSARRSRRKLHTHSRRKLHNLGHLHAFTKKTSHAFTKKTSHIFTKKTSQSWPSPRATGDHLSASSGHAPMGSATGQGNARLFHSKRPPTQENNICSKKSQDCAYTRTTHERVQTHKHAHTCSHTRTHKICVSQ